MPLSVGVVEVDTVRGGALALAVDLAGAHADVSSEAREGAPPQGAEDDEKTKREAPIPASHPGKMPPPGLASQAASQPCTHARTSPAARLFQRGCELGRRGLGVRDRRPCKDLRSSFAFVSFADTLVPSQDFGHSCRWIKGTYFRLG